MLSKRCLNCDKVLIPSKATLKAVSSMFEYHKLHAGMLVGLAWTASENCNKCLLTAAMLLRVILNTSPTSSRKQRLLLFISVFLQHEKGINLSCHIGYHGENVIFLCNYRLLTIMIEQYQTCA